MIFYTPYGNSRLLKNQAKELLQKVSPLPWYIETYPSIGQNTVIQSVKNLPTVMQIGKRINNKTVPLSVDDLDAMPFAVDLCIKEDDMRFILCACNLVPYLL